MIVRDCYDDADPEALAVCMTCREPVRIADLDDRGGNQPMTRCCDSIAYVVDIEPAAKLAGKLGAGWASFIAVPRVLMSAPLTPSTKLVAIELVGWMNLREVFPSHETLAERTGLSARTVRRALADLERAGMLARTRRHGHKGQLQSSYLDLDPLRDALNALAANLAATTTSARSPSGQIGRYPPDNLAGTPPDKLAEDVEELQDQEQQEVERATSRREVAFWKLSQDEIAALDFADLLSDEPQAGGQR